MYLYMFSVHPCSSPISLTLLRPLHVGDQVPAELREGCLGAALAIWTTTPWTMPANAAVAVNEKLLYSLVEAHVSFDACWLRTCPVDSARLA